MGYQEHKHKSPGSVTCAVIIISGTRTEQNDESGKLITQMLESNGHKVSSFSILKNDADSILKKLDQLLAQIDEPAARLSIRLSPGRHVPRLVLAERRGRLG